MKRLLIANRGEIARRILRTAHRLGMDTVAVHSDADAGALHVREAGHAVALPGDRPADTYLNIGRLLEAARASGADAVHPGYGFLSENPDFAQAVIDAGLTWVGPPPEAIRALGSKSAAKALAQRHGVPVLPGFFGADQRDDTLAAEAARIGYPVMVKAAAGGGGRGMRLVHEPGQLLAALHSARAEAMAGFGSEELLIERAVRRPRHVEVQVFADAHGQVVHLGERDCSVQRRHQKIIEEAPSPAVSSARREELGRAAVALARAAGYVGAGTVEFLIDEDAEGGEGAFYLMEMNTRLQVEHPVTEMITGLDLVAWQLQVARGEPLPLTQEALRFDGHAVEVRLCAEDAHFRPHTGRVQDFVAPVMAPGLRLDHALENGTEVTPHYDALLGKLIAHAPTRAQALDALGLALAQTRVLGLPSNRALLAACVQHPVFRAGRAGIPFLAEHGEALRASLRAGPRAVGVAALAVAFADRPPAAALPLPFARPWRLAAADGPGDDARPLTLWLQELGRSQVRVAGHEAGLTQADGDADDAFTATVLERDGPAWRLRVEGALWRVHAVPVGGGRTPRWQVQVEGPQALGVAATAHEVWFDDLAFTPPRRDEDPQAARELRAPFNGRLVALHTQAGQHVTRGTPLLAMESMKLEHRLDAPHDAVVEAVLVEPGQQLSPGQVLIRFATA